MWRHQMTLSEIKNDYIKAKRGEVEGQTECQNQTKSVILMDCGGIDDDPFIEVKPIDRCIADINSLKKDINEIKNDLKVVRNIIIRKDRAQITTAGVVPAKGSGWWFY